MTNKVLQLRRGSTVDHQTFTGAVGELTVDTTAKVVKLHDGLTAGGIALAKADLSNLSLSAPLNANSQRITNVTDPVGNQDVATKHYVDVEVADLQGQINALGGGSSSITDEIDAIETSVGLETDGTKTNFNTSLVTPSASFKTAIEELDSELTSTNTSVGSKASQALVDQVISSSGLEETGHYEADVNANYISAVTSLKQADLVLDTTLQSEVDRAVAAEGVLTTNLANEVNRATAAEIVLQGNIDTEKSRIDAILLGADADLNSFTEIVNLINSIDTTNDGALATEIQARIDGDSTEAGLRAAADLVLQGNINAEETARQVADGLLQDAIDQEVSDRQNADNALDARLDTLEGDSTTVGSVAKALADAETYADNLVSAEATIRQTADDALDGRLSTAENEIDALQADLNTLTGRVNTAETDIDTLETSVALKASQADLTTLEGRVTTAELDIDSLETTVSGHTTAIGSLTTELNALETSLGVMIDEDGSFIPPANTRNYILGATSVTNSIELLDTALKTVEDALSSVSSSATEEAQDAAAAMLTSGSHTGITFTYGQTQDDANRIDAVVSLADFNLSELSDVSDVAANASDVLRYSAGSWIPSDSLSTLETTVTSQGTSISNLSSDLSTQTGRIDAILLAADADKDSFAEIVSLINSIDTTNDQAFAGFASNVDSSMGGATNGVKANFASSYYIGTTNSYNLAIELLDVALYSTDSNLSTLSGSVTGLESRVNLAETDINNLETDLMGLDVRVTTVEGNVSTLQSDVSVAQTSITTLQGDVSTAQTDIVTLDGRLDIAESDISSLDGRLDTAESNITTLQGQMSTAQSDISSLEGRMGSAESSITTLQSDVSTLQTETLTSVEGTLNEISVSVSNRVATVSLPQDVSISRNLTVDNNIVSTSGNLSIQDGNVSISAGDLTVGGNIVVVGNLTSAQAVFTSVAAKFKDPLLSVGYDNASATADLGFYIKDSGAKFQGLISDTSDSGKWKLVKNLSTDPGTNNIVDFTSALYSDIQVAEVTVSSVRNTNVVSKSADYTLQSSESIIFTDNSYNATLPSASTVGSGKTYEIKVTHSGNKSITLLPSGGQTIDGYSTNATITGDHPSVKVMSNGSNWFIMSALGTVAYV
jgi:predicted  nucleic acid-binding Zn-ribbon protein